MSEGAGVIGLLWMCAAIVVLAWVYVECNRSDRGER